MDVGAFRHTVSEQQIFLNQRLLRSNLNPYGADFRKKLRSKSARQPQFSEHYQLQ